MSEVPATGFRRVLVVGCGLIGGSFALASRSVAGVEQVVVADASADVRAHARELGLADEVVADASSVVAEADLVVLATPVPAMVAVAQALAPSMHMQQVLTDVGSVKSRLTPSISQVLEGRTAYVGGHPMAGSERSGPRAADGTIFQGATWLLTPTGDAPAAAFERLASHLRRIGARVLAVDPERHDRLVAAVSHLPQLLASTLMRHASRRAEQEPALLRVAAGGFRDVTRVAASDAALWRGILEENRPAVLSELDAYLVELGEVRDALAAGRWEDVERLLATAAQARRELPGGKDVDGSLHDLVVPLPDTPGALAAVTTALGEAGTNIEDLSMRHADDGARGALVIAIAGRDRAEAARRTLVERGLAAHLEAR